MMRLLHRSFFSLALVLILFGLAGAQDATYTVQLKASPTRAEAEEEVRQLRAKNIPAYIVKSDVPGKGVFYRIRAGVFPNRDDAKRFGADLRAPVDELAAGFVAELGEGLICVLAVGLLVVVEAAPRILPGVAAG